MKKHLKYILLLVAIGIASAIYMYNKPHQNMQNAKPDFSMEAAQLLADFESDETASNTKYLDKVIELTGTVRESGTDEEGVINITLETDNELSGVICELDNLSTHDKTVFKAGESLRVKGICTGMLMDVIMVRCVISDKR